MQYTYLQDDLNVIGALNHSVVVGTAGALVVGTAVALVVGAAVRGDLFLLQLWTQYYHLYDAEYHVFAGMSVDSERNSGCEW